MSKRNVAVEESMALQGQADERGCDSVKAEQNTAARFYGEQS